MINIAYIINRIEVGGPSNVIRNLIASTDRTQLNVFVITLFDGKDNPKVVEELKAQNVKVINLKYSNSVECFFKYKRIDAVIKKYKITILHSHGFIPDYFVKKTRLCVKKISTLHCRLFEDYPEVYGKVKGIVLARIHLHYLKYFDKVVCCSKAVYLHTKTHINNLTYIENGIVIKEDNIKKTRNELGIPEDGLIFIYTGQLRKRKNVHWLITEFVRIHDDNEYLVILGKGPEELTCKSAADDNVIFFGFRENVIDYLKVSDVFISASLSEGFSISVLEALENGLTVFLSDIPSHKEIFEIDDHYYIGEFFSTNDFETQFYKLRNNLPNSNHNQIKEFMKKYLSANHMSKRYQEIYESL